MADMVLCYARRDGAVAAWLRSLLHARGVDVWVDWERVRPSDFWMQAVFSAIDAAPALCFVATPGALGSRNCLAELSYALQMGKRIDVFPAVAAAALLPEHRPPSRSRSLPGRP